MEQMKYLTIPIVLLMYYGLNPPSSQVGCIIRVWSSIAALLSIPEAKQLNILTVGTAIVYRRGQ